MRQIVPAAACWLLLLQGRRCTRAALLVFALRHAAPCCQQAVTLSVHALHLESCIQQGGHSRLLLPAP